ncbi:MAG: hypothetical protein J6E44_09595 [Lachnospiraceae bacterium]|nr:hypothetical protein [Lachnospiraceae bacterium]MBP3913240.1 hypothetical protein [Lachnospiraceae bacterium]
MKKTFGYVMTVIGTILSLVALFFYSKSGSTATTRVFGLNIAALIVCVVFLILALKLENEYLTLLVAIGAVLMIAACGYSLVTEVETLGYLISGLRTWADVQYWAYFAGCAVASWLVLLIASFTGFGLKKK